MDPRSLASPPSACYWYSLIDLDPQREAIEGFHVDENEYHMGLVKYDGYRKHAWQRFKDLLTPAREEKLEVSERGRP